MTDQYLTVGDDRLLIVNGIEFTVTTSQVAEFKAALASNTTPFWCTIGATEFLINEATQINVRVHVDGYKLAGGFDLRNADDPAITVP